MAVVAIHARVVTVYTGVSTDTKPTTRVPEGSRFLERDTGREYIYDGTSWGQVNGTPANIQNVSLRASSAAASGDSQATAVSGLSRYTTATIMLDVTAVAGTSPTLDAAIQRLLPDGALYDTIHRFAQMTAAATRVADIQAAPSAGSRAIDSTVTVTSASLAAGASRDVPWGDTLRVIETVGGSDTPTVTNSVTANFRV